MILAHGTQSSMAQRGFEGTSWTLKAKATYNLCASVNGGDSTGVQNALMYIVLNDKMAITVSRSVDWWWNSNILYAQFRDGSVSQTSELPLAPGDVMHAESNQNWVRATYWWELQRNDQRFTLRYSSDGINYIDAFDTTVDALFPGKTAMNNQAIRPNASVWTTVGSTVDWDYIYVTQNSAQDTTAPTTTATITSGTEGTNGWYTSNAGITLTATDPTPSSDIATITYTVDTSLAVIVTGSSAIVPINGDGIHNIVFYATDKAGNTEAPQAQEVKIDTSAG